MSHVKVITFCLVLSSGLATPLPADASDLVVIWLKDGRMLAGEVDPRTSDERLWLRSTAPTFVVSTSAAWDRIRAVNSNGEQVAVAAFFERIDQYLPAQEDPNLPPLPDSEINAHVTTAVTRPVPRNNAVTQVVSLDVEARVANWDRDAVTDGVELRVLPRNTFGEIIPVSGQVKVDLVARSRRPAGDPHAFPRLGRWSIRAERSDFGPHGAVYRLPFRVQHPDETFSVEPHGSVELTLYVAGQGRFSSEATIYLPSFNPIRRDRQRHAADRDR